jgi:DNA-binding PucR family transcriptional regulator
MATAEVDAAAEQAVREMLVAAAQAVERDADDIASEIADVLIREVPEIAADAETREDIVLRGRAGLLAWARAFLRGVAPDQVESPAEAYAYARALARRGVPLDVLLRIHRLALSVLLQAWESRLDAGSSAELLLAATRRSIDINFQFHDALMEGLSAEYQRERERWVRGAEAMRRETITAILAEKAVDTDGAGRILGYDLRRHHIGLVLWAVPTPDDPQVLPRLERAATAASAHLEAGRPLMLSVDGSTMWAWLGRDSELPRELIDSLAAVPNADGVSIALGASGQGPAGFRRTHRDAADTAKVAIASQRRPGTVTAFHAVELAALFADDPERTRRFVHERLGALASDDDESHRLRATLMLYLEENGSRVATAKRIGVHPNTVANRIRACREILGREVGHEQVPLLVALTLAATLGPAVLRTVPDRQVP